MPRNALPLAYLLVLPLIPGSVVAEDQVVIEEILVTAQKREQTLNEVPMSVQVVTGERFIEQGFNDLEDVASFVPGLTVEQTRGGATVRIRGISNEGFNVGFEQATAVFNDGVYYGRQLQAISGVYDIEQMEVLFGPQPVYFGQSAIAGLIGYRSKRPGSELDGYVVAEVGDIGHRKIEGAVTIPLSGTWSIRGTGKFTENDGWTERFGSGEDGNANEDTAFRLQIAGDVTEKFSVWAKYEEFEQETDGFAEDAVVCSPVFAGAPPLVFCDNAAAAGLAEWEYNDTISVGGGLSAAPFGMAPFGNFDLTGLELAQLDALGNDIEGSAAALELIYELDNGVTITSLTGYSDYDARGVNDFDYSPYASLVIPSGEKFEQTSTELRVQSNNDGGLNWMAGIYWQDQEIDFETDIISSLPNPMGPSGTNASQYVEDAEYFGAFGAVSYDITDTVTVEYGIRYNDVQKQAYIWEVDSFLTDASGSRVTNAGPAAPGMTPASLVPNGTQATGYSGLQPEMVQGDRCLGDTPNNDDCQARLLAAGIPQVVIDGWGDTDLDLDEDEVTQQVSVNWRFSDNANVFVRYAEAFKPGGFSRGSSSFLVNTKGVYQAEKADSIEIGGYLRFADGRGQANLTFFTTDYTNRQVNSQFDDPVTGATNFIFINAADSTIEGFEAAVSYITGVGLRMNLGMNYAKGEFDSFENAACFRAEIRLGFCQGGVIDLSGTDFDGQPDWNLAGGLGYEFSVSGNLRMDISTDFSVYDDYDRARRNSSQLPYDYRSQDGYTLINARVALFPENRSWEVAVWGKNLADELYWQTQPGEVGIFGTAFANISRPATYGATFRYNFGS